MVAKMAMDKGVSILPQSQFNYNGENRSEITMDEARAILNFQIEKKPCYTEAGEVIPRMFYLGRSDGGVIDAQCSVGDEFNVTAQPMETLDFAEFVISKFPGLRLETVATMYNGGSAFVNLSLGDSWVVKGDTSPHNTNVLFCNPLTRGRFLLVSHSIRVVCMNTLQAACRTGEGFRFAHTKYARARVENALEVIRGEIESANELRRQCEFLASKSITSEQVNLLLDQIYPLPVIKEGDKTNGLTRMQNARAEVMKQFESDKSFTDKSFYTFLNANTYLSEHPLHKQARVDGAQVAFENIVGNRADAKARIFSKVWAMANGSEVVDAEYKMIA